MIKLEENKTKKPLFIRIDTIYSEKKSEKKNLLSIKCLSTMTRTVISRYFFISGLKTKRFLLWFYFFNKVDVEMFWEELKSSFHVCIVVCLHNWCLKWEKMIFPLWIIPSRCDSRDLTLSHVYTKFFLR